MSLRIRGREPKANWTQRSLCPPTPFCRGKVRIRVVVEFCPLRLARDTQDSLLISSSGSPLSSGHLGNGDKGCSIVPSVMRPSWHLCSEMKLGTCRLCWARRMQKVGGLTGASGPWAVGCCGRRQALTVLSEHRWRAARFPQRAHCLLASKGGTVCEVRICSPCEQRAVSMSVPSGKICAELR